MLPRDEGVFVRPAGIFSRSTVPSSVERPGRKYIVGAARDDFAAAEASGFKSNPATRINKRIHRV